MGIPPPEGIEKVVYAISEHMGHLPTELRRGRKTGPKPSFTSDDVVNAALAIGIDRFTLGQISHIVGITTSALYRIFKGRDDIVHACLEKVARSADWDLQPDYPWERLLRTWAQVTWDMCEKYPGLSHVLATIPDAHIHIKSELITLIDGLRSQGFDTRDVVFALDFIGETVISTHVGATAWRRFTAEGKADAMVRRFPERPEFQLVGKYSDQSTLNERIDFIIDGIRARREGR